MSRIAKGYRALVSERGFEFDPAQAELAWKTGRVERGA